VALDFDECCDSVTREIRPDVLELLERLNTYCEYSPSGRGVRAFLLGELNGPNVTAKAAGYEMYAEGAYVTVTGFRVPGTPATVARDEGVIAELVAEAETAKQAGRNGSTARKAATGLRQKADRPAGHIPAPHHRDDAEVLSLAIASQAGAGIERLYAGQWQGEYPTQSEAELALANHLAFYAGSGGEGQVESLMRSSGLCREKFGEGRGEGRTYLSLTVAKAFEGRTDFYAGRQEKKKRHREVIDLPNGMASTGPANLNDSSTLTDVGLARRLVHEAAGKLRYVREWRSWLSWGGRRWQQDDGLAASHVAKQVSDNLWRELSELPPERRGQVLNFVKAASSARGIEAAVRLARSEPQVVVSADELNRHHYLLNVANGTIDLATAEMRAHSPADLLTHVASVTFDPNAGAPNWRRFISEVTDGDEELARFLQRSAGLALSGDVTEQVLWLHHGEGRNGKSTFLNVLVELLGTYAGPAPMEMLLVRRGLGREVETQFAALAGKRLVTTVEADSGVRFSEATVKLLTGGDTVLARRLYEDAWPLKPSWKLHVAANHKPAVAGRDEGIWRRLMLTPWLRRFEGSADDKRLKEKLLAELPGILNWCLAGFIQWREGGGLRPPVQVTVATAGYREENDAIGTWAEECCVREANAVAEAGRLYSSYRAWAEERGEHPMTATAFGRELERLGFRSERPSDGRYRHRTIRRGIGLLSTADE